jgi:uncharacterized protein
VTRRTSAILILLALALAVLQLTACRRKADYPPPSDRAVNDFAGLLSPRTVEQLEKLSRSLWEQSRDAVVVVTVESIAPETVEGYAVGLYKEWGIGEEGKDSGVLVLVAEKERKTRIEVGYGLEGIIPDAEASRIIRDLMLPSFRAGDYNRGVDLAVRAVIGCIARERGLEIADLEPEPRSTVRATGPKNKAAPVWLLPIVLLVMLLIIRAFSRLEAARGKTRSGGFWTGSGGGFRSGSGGGFGGGFSGGFGGFGGGMSGGGGASGGW